ncbi:inositol monophosphatase family protein [Mesoaciditoga lauensis]|uniref:inositol monophosphatase family protein n=1 Tax=Mesoaciditoga lauensis TaxID=1495039 RepID=UPI0005626A63|nr:inositol monophosphatase family protein [Mesoaciditoga lauensis]
MDKEVLLRFEFAKGLAYELGNIIKENVKSLKWTKTKSGFYDIVTNVDVEVERRLKERVSLAFPNDVVFGEETGIDEKATPDNYMWVVDPIDGTTNFSKKVPHSCVSIAITYKTKPIAGVVYDPFMDELFEAIKGEGAFLNGKRISVSDTKNLEDAVVNTGYQYSAVHMRDKVLKDYEAFFGKVRALRIFGSAVLDLCYVAAGRIDGFWEYELKPWDMAAGALIVEESGGIVMDLLSENFTIYSKSILATSPTLLSQMLKVLKEA